MDIVKVLWGIRALFYKPFFGKLGEKSYIGKPIITKGRKNIFIGNKVRIYPGNRLETYKDGRIVIEDDVSIGQNFHCTSASDLRIGKKTTVSGNVFITNIDHDYEEINTHILKQPMKIKETTIGDNCFIGYGASIQAGTKLGKQCVVGTNAVVRGEFPDYCVIAGVPAKIIKKYNPRNDIWEKY